MTAMLPGVGLGTGTWSTSAWNEIWSIGFAITR